MIVFVGGCRTITDYQLVVDAIKESGFNITLLVSGEQVTYKDRKPIGGADYWAKVYAQKNNIPYRGFSAEWNKWGKIAGFIRNRQALEWVKENDPEGGYVGCWDGLSRGTGNAIDIANKLDLKVYVKRV